MLKKLEKLQATKILAIFGFYGVLVNISHFIQLATKEEFGGIMGIFLASDMTWNNSNIFLLLGSSKKKLKWFKIYFGVATMSCILHIVSAVFIGKYSEMFIASGTAMRHTVLDTDYPT